MDRKTTSFFTAATWVLALAVTAGALSVPTGSHRAGVHPKEWTNSGSHRATVDPNGRV